MKKRSNAKAYISLALLLIMGAVFLLYPKIQPATSEAAELFRTMAGDVDNKSGYFAVRAEGPALGGVVIFPDDKEDPVSYAPMAQKLSALGMDVRIVRYPMGRANFKTDPLKLLHESGDLRWVSIGIGKGAEKACQLGDGSPEVAGLILIGSCSGETNLNDNDLQIIMYQVELEPMDEALMQQIRNKLPADTRFIRVGSRDELLGNLMDSGQARVLRAQSDLLSDEILRILAAKPVPAERGD